jgi:hypothetical protein
LKSSLSKDEKDDERDEEDYGRLKSKLS